MYQNLTEKIAGKPEERILSFLMLRSLKQARYSEANAGHVALAATSYTHFTSPIRRYPDLIVHRILKDVLRDSAQQWDGEVPIGTNLHREVFAPSTSLSAPEGRSNLAQRFSAGKTEGSTQVPEGRPNRGENAPDETRAGRPFDSLPPVRRPGQAPLHPAPPQPSPSSNRPHPQPS